MQKLSFKIIFTVLVIALKIFPQQYSIGSPEWLVDKFFSSTSFEDKADYYTDEMLNDTNQPTIGEEVSGENAQILFSKINDGKEEKTFAVELEVNDQVIDFYIYLKKFTDTWKISAVRRFLLPGFLYEALDSLSNIASISAADQNLANTLKLFTMNDAGLKNFLSKNVDKLFNLVWYFNQKETDLVNNELKNTGCSAVFKDNRFTGCVFVQVNSFNKMEVGFIYASGNYELPSVSPGEFIYIEEVLPDWYIYRIM